MGKIKVDKRKDNADYTIVQIINYYKDHPDASKNEICEALGISRPTLNKYWDKIIYDAELDFEKTIFPKCPAVNYSDSEILKNILRLYLPQENTFECDLTYGEGVFYKNLPEPKLRYDIEKDLQSSFVKPLHEIGLIKDSTIKSVVIDLPVEINPHSKDYKAFKNLDEKYNAYQNMIGIASRIIKPDGIMVFKTSDFVVRNDENMAYEEEWSTDKAIEFSLAEEFDLIDQFILVQDKGILTSATKKLTGSLKHSFFLVFKKL